MNQIIQNRFLMRILPGSTSARRWADTMIRSFVIITLTVLFGGCDLINPASSSLDVNDSADLPDDSRENTIFHNLSIQNSSGLDTSHFSTSDSVHISYSILNDTADSLLIWRCDCPLSVEFTLHHSPDPNIVFDILDHIPWHLVGISDLMPPGEMWVFDTIFVHADTGRYMLHFRPSFLFDSTVYQYPVEYSQSGGEQHFDHTYVYFEG